MKKKALGGVVTAIVSTGLVTTVHAEELPQTQEATVAQQSTVTEADVKAAHGVVEATDKAVKEQEAIVAEGEAELKVATENSNQAQDSLVKATELAEKATPEGIAAAEGAVTESEAALSVAEAGVVAAEKKLDEATEAVTVQEGVVASEEAQKTIAANEVSQAQEAVNSAQAVLDGTGAAEIIQAANQAKEDLASAQQAVETAKANLQSAQSADAAHQQSIDTVQSELSTTNSNLATAQANLAAASATSQSATQALAQAQSALRVAENDYQSLNVITLTPEYMAALRDYTHNYATKGAEAVAILTTESAKLAALHKYKVNPNDDNTVTYDLNNLPTDVITELSLFGSDLLNQIRKRMGNEPTVVTASSVAFADKVTDNAVAANWDSWSQGHNDAGISAAAQEYALFGSNDVANYFENWAGMGSGDKLTLSQLKQKVYDSVILFMFPTRYLEWMHADSIAGERDALIGRTATVEYFALDTMYTRNYIGLHFLGVDDTMLTSASTNFDTTPIANPKSAEVITNQYTAAQLALQTAVSADSVAKSALATAQSAVEALSKTLSEQQATLAALEAQPLQTATAQTSLLEAQAVLVKAEATDANAQLALNNLTADVKVKEAALATAKQNLADKQLALETATQQLLQETTKLEQLKLTLDQAREALVAAEQAVTDKQLALNNAQQYVADLKYAPTLLENAKLSVSVTQAELEKVRSALRSEVVILDELKLLAASAKEYYAAVLTRYQAVLEAELQSRLAKEKAAIEARGGVSLPVFDVTGKLVAYVEKEKTQSTAQTVKGSSLATSPVKKGSLPETGSQSTAFLSMLGLVGLFGLVTKRRKNNN